MPRPQEAVDQQADREADWAHVIGACTRSKGQWLPSAFIRWQMADSSEKFTREKERIGAQIEPSDLHRVENLPAGNLPAIRWNHRTHCCLSRWCLIYNENHVSRPEVGAIDGACAGRKLKVPHKNGGFLK